MSRFVPTASARRAPTPVIQPGSSVTPELQPTVAVIPFTARGEEPRTVLGEVLADEIIGALSRAAELNVISRLSTTVFRGREASLGEVGGYLNATYVLSGGFRVSGNAIQPDVELADARSGNSSGRRASRATSPASSRARTG